MVGRGSRTGRRQAAARTAVAVARAVRPGRLEGRSELAIRFPWIDREVVREQLRASHAAYELALEQSLRTHARPYVARSRAGLAQTLARRAAPGDAAQAQKLSALAATGARELGMTRLQRELEPTPTPQQVVDAPDRQRLPVARGRCARVDDAATSSG